MDAELVTEPPGTPPLSSGVQSALGIGADPLYRSGMERLGSLGGERQKAQAAFEDQSSGLQKQISSERESAARLQPPKLANVPEKFEYKGMSQQELGDATTTMFALAALGGLMTRTPMTAALSAFSEGVNGLVKGDQIAFGRAKDEFDRNFKVAIAKNAEARQEYQDAFAKHRGNMADLMNEWTIIAKKHGDTVSATNMERQDIQGQLRHIEAMGKMDQQARQTHDRMMADARRQTESERANRVREAGKDWEMRIRDRALDIKELAAGAKQLSSEEGKARFSSALDELEGYHNKLYDLGGAIDTEGTKTDNVLNRIGASGAGQIVGGALGTDVQSERNKMALIKPLIMIELKNATGMSAQQLNSNVELQTYLSAATNPAIDIQANREAIKSLRRIVEKMPQALPKEPGSPPSALGGGWTPEKEQRYQYLSKRRGSGTQ